METMEPLNETIELDLEESNDLTFKIKMEGAAAAPAKVRLVCEGGDFAYMFNGYGTGEDEVVQFTLPRMDKKITEGTYNARVEVLVDNRYFAPLQFQINFKKTLSVVAESIRVVPKASRPDITVTASSISVARPVAPVSTIKFEQRPTPTAQPAPLPPVAQHVQVEPRPAPVPQQTSPGAPPAGKFSLREAYMNKMGLGGESTSTGTTLRDKLKK
jgi:hypothetical protein